MNHEIILEVRGLNRSFGGLHAVNQVSFMVRRNSIKAVIGPNGAGKTTLFNLITGTLKPDSGEVFADSVPIHGLPPFMITRKGLARTFQNVKLFSRMSVLENVMIGAHTRSRAGFLSGMLNLPGTWKEESELIRKSEEILDFFGMADLAHADVMSLPFGKQRIVEFARALATEPALLFLDEPAAGLNMHETAQIAELIVKIKKLGLTVLIIEHDMSLVMDISDEVLVLGSGKKIAEGTPNEIQKNAEVVKIYLGEDDA